MGSAGGGGGGRGTPTIPRKMQKVEDSEDYFTLTVHGRENYELLCRVNEALELSSRIPDYERQLYLKQRPDSQISNEELLICSSMDQSDLSSSKTQRKGGSPSMTLPNVFEGYKPLISKPQYKAPTNLY